MISRCKWANYNNLLQSYHDTEYGFYVEDDNILFERLMLEGYQAGLSWNLVLQKREEFNNVFYNFSLSKVSNLTAEYIDKLMLNEGIIRNRRKLEATISNAQTILKIIEKYGSFMNYLKHLPHNAFTTEDLKNCTKQMKKDGFKFVGPLVLEEFFYSIGLNSPKHAEYCFLFK
ncbi:MAG: DNA-3-methyladenine glycosylase I [Candidatus Heimdallarchaeota archaeon]|nr:DNA-3-methyladenine glycosylase I [Candidatus Heimdallarchaeota archaeon]